MRTTTSTDQRLKIAVFIDYDNIEIGVKTTLGEHFDTGAILEAIKERGEVVTKVAYGDWKRAGEDSRTLTQHAIRMVQRNVTPGGDKNGADINLALDALEMALTHDHINAYVIVAGDSDFITLVEKLKQYDKTVFVVGGRAFTSQILQKNCHEFIAYENLIAPSLASRKVPDKARPINRNLFEQALPLVRRALKILTDREVAPQLGLLKSTLLQLDSTFSERTYGGGSFRDFVEKLAQAGLVHLRHTGRGVLVELPEAEGGLTAPDEPPSDRVIERPAEGVAAVAAPAPAEEPRREVEPQTPEEPQPTLQPMDAIRLVRTVFEGSSTPPRWPMYVRNVKQMLRAADPSFDERKYGFSGILDLLRSCQRDGLFRLERDRQGVLRVYPGAVLSRVLMDAAAAHQGRLDQPAPEPAVDAEVVPDHEVESPEAESGMSIEVRPPGASEDVEAEVQVAAAPTPEAPPLEMSTEVVEGEVAGDAAQPRESVSEPTETGQKPRRRRAAGTTTTRRAAGGARKAKTPTRRSSRKTGER